MNKLTKIFLTLLMAASGALSTDALPQNRFLEEAKALKNGQRYELAAVSYEYAFYKTNDSVLKNYALLQKALCLKELNKYEEAYSTLKRITVANMPDTLIFNAYYQAAVLNYLMQKPEASQTDLLNIYNLITDSVLIGKTILLQCLLNISLERWDEAKETFNTLMRENNLSVNVDSLFNVNIEQKNEKKASLYSFLLPGAGQTYASKPLDGLFSFAATGGSGYLTVWHFLNGYYFIGSTAGVFLFTKFYFGGPSHARHLVQDYNSRKMLKFKSDLSISIINLVNK